MANDLSFGQLSTVLAAITSQATGTAVAAPVDTSSFITVGQTALKAGYDPIIGSLSQVLSKTIFSTRPYYRKFGSLQVSNQQYGNHVRKLQVSDKPFEDDQRLDLQDGQSVDHYNVNKPSVLQTNFYGAEQYQKHMTIFTDQLDSALSGPEEFASFLSMVTGNVSDMIEQAHESTARMTVANMIGGRLMETNTPNVFHLLTEYNAATGLSLTATTVMQPDNFPAFMKWVYARIAAISALMTERSEMFHTNIANHTIMRHTQPGDQLLYMFAPGKMQTDAMVLSDAYHDNYLKFGASEIVNYWQSIKSPDVVDVKPVYLDTTGALVNSSTSTNQSNVFALLADREAMGYTVVNERTYNTPINAAGGFYNQYWHFTDRYWNDFSENSVVFLLD